MISRPILLALFLMFTSVPFALACDEHEDCQKCLAIGFDHCLAWSLDVACEQRKRKCLGIPELPDALLFPKYGYFRAESYSGGVRAYLRAVDIPPPGLAAYGVVAFRAKPTSASRARLLRVCEAFKAYLPRQQSLPSSVALSDQMLTIWPLDDPTASKAQADDCDFVIDHYDLYGGISAMGDAIIQHAKLDGDGPFLIGWSPSNSRGVPDKLVLVVDLSNFDTQESINELFMFWQQKVVENPELWRSGFSLERVRISIRDFADKYGEALVSAFKMVGL
jgi:hypothetical protein